MSFDTITTFAAGLSDAANLNVLINNVNAVSVQNKYSYKTPSLLSNTSTSYVDVDATNLTRSITTKGGDILVLFNGTVYPSTSGAIQRVRITLDDVEQVFTAHHNAAIHCRTPLSIVLTGLVAGTYEISVEYSITTGTIYLLAGAFFYIKEI